MSRTYLLTGGTGFLGTRLSLALLQRGDRVVFLGRSKDKKPLTDRIRANLATVNPSLVSQVAFDSLEVDLAQRDLGLAPKSIEGLKNTGVAGIWHAAANLSFEESDREQVFSTNLLGTQNVLALSEKIGGAFYHISTAYVHGNRRGHILESDLIKPEYFNNSYEESKFEAESLLRAKPSTKNLVIFRPSILIGQGAAEKVSTLGYYSVVNALHACKVRWLRSFRNKKGPTKQRLRFPLPFLYSRSAHLNLLPSDIAVNLMLQIAESPAAAGETFHITNPNPFSMEEITRQTFEALEMVTTIIGAPRWLAGMYLSALTHMGSVTKRLPVAFLRTLETYKNYMVQNNVYDMQNTKRIIGERLETMFHFNGKFIKERADEFLAARQRERTSIRRAFSATRRQVTNPVGSP